MLDEALMAVDIDAMIAAQRGVLDEDEALMAMDIDAMIAQRHVNQHQEPNRNHVVQQSKQQYIQHIERVQTPVQTQYNAQYGQQVDRVRTPVQTQITQYGQPNIQPSSYNTPQRHHQPPENSSTSTAKIAE